MTADEPARKRRNISRGISRNTITQRHPLNVKPSGNAIIFQDSSLIQSKNSQLGKFKDFTDELLLDLLSYIDDPRDLLNLSHTSRVFYAFIYDEGLWRNLYIQKALSEPDQEKLYPLDIKTWKGSWRRTLLQVPREREAMVQLPDNLLCSDILFRPFQCSKIDYKSLLKDLIDEEEESYKLGKTQNVKFGIERIEENKLSKELFNKEYHDKPFILTNTSNNQRWPKWSLPALKKRFPDVKFRQESVKWPLEFYSQYFEENQDESPLYLFDCQSTAMKQLVQEYTVPAIFAQDLFQTFNNGDITCRPDYRWIIVGPERSGSTFHKDPNYTSAWNANLTGKKLWVMLPPGIKPPGVGTDDEESEVTSPVGIAEWVLSGFYNDSLKLALQGQCQIGVTFPGECMFVPSGWWHSVINLEDSVALTQNFVTVPTMPNVLNFFKNKNDQISGFHVKDFTKSLKAFITEKKSNVDVENLAIFEEFLSKVDEIEVDNEDVGEYQNYPKLPIFELFIELIKDSEYKNCLSPALEKLKNIELEEYKKNQRNRQVVASKKWENLIKPEEKETSIASTFSFNFEESDEE